ncbi:MAG TPA: TIM-barrel domain-containing protein [Candidatus Acidoferrum sp.]|nr:TIM-barrel domain-containing protein [Candidatus Acidoferrum sp.]
MSSKNDKSPANFSRRNAIALLGAAGAATLFTPWGSPISEGAPQQEGGAPILIAGQRAELHITIVTPYTLRITAFPVQSDGSVPVLKPDPVLLERNWPEPALKIRALARPQGRTQFRPQSVPWGELQVRIFPEPLTVFVQGRRGRIIPRLRFDLEDGSVSFDRGIAPIYALGEGGPQFDRGGEEYPMRNGEGVAGLDIWGARMAIPWVVGAPGWGLFSRQPYGTFDLRSREGRFVPSASESALPLDFFLVTSEDPADIFKEYAQLTGFPHLPPIWSLGYQQSHRTLSSREEILTEAKTFREKKLPCDALIYLGTGFCPSGWNTGHGSFTFNDKVFPDPEAMIRDLHKENFRFIPHVVLKARHLHGEISDTGAAAQDPEDIAAYWATHLKVFEMGTDGWWPDEGDWLPPEERLLRNRMYWDGPISSRPDVRPYALNRNGYAGMQRYGWLWSGDVESTWRTLAAQIPVGINTGLSGQPFWGTDTGGFVTTPELTGELYVRWFQFSSFCPLFRSHGRTWKLRLPWGWDTGEYGPEEMNGYHGDAGLPAKSELHNAEVEPICRKYLNLRYQLLPYLYSVVKEASETGMPIQRALWLHYPDDTSSIECSNQYLWGRDILVAPVTEKAATHKRVYLPPDTWYDFWSGEKITGSTTLNRAIDLGTLPLYIRAGAILPMGPVKQYTTEKTSGPLVFHVYPGVDGQFDLYEDDGTSFGYKKGTFTLLRASWNDAQKKFTLSHSAGVPLAVRRKFEVQLAGAAKARPLAFDGKEGVVQFQG